MKTQNQKSSRFAGMTKSELAKLIQQYGCGPVRFSGTDEALYERHLVFDNVMEMSRDRRSRTLRGHRSLGARCFVAALDSYGKDLRASKCEACLLSLDGISHRPLSRQ